MSHPYNAKNAASVSCEIHHTVRWRRFHFICLYSFRREPLSDEDVRCVSHKESSGQRKSV